MNRAVLLIDHGSKRAAAHHQLIELGQRLSSFLEAQAESWIVEVAHMEIASPSIAEGVAACVARGAQELWVLPCFLSRGRHVTEDIPQLLEEAARAFPELQVRMTPPLVELDGFIPFLASALAEQSSSAKRQAD